MFASPLLRLAFPHSLWVAPLRGRGGTGGDDRGDPVAAGGVGAGDEAAAERGDAFLHADQAVAAAGQAGRGRAGGRAVLDEDGYLLDPVGDADERGRAHRVLVRV